MLQNNNVNGQSLSAQTPGVATAESPLGLGDLPQPLVPVWKFSKFNEQKFLMYFLLCCLMQYTTFPLLFSKIGTVVGPFICSTWSWLFWIHVQILQADSYLMATIYSWNCYKYYYCCLIQLYLCPSGKNNLIKVKLQ